MKKSVLYVAATTLGIMSQAASAAGWTVLPGLKEGYVAAPTVALIGGVSGTADTTDVGYGAEFSLNCALLQPPTNKIRTYLNYVMTPSDGDVTTHNIELNPHYVVEVAKGVWVGGGPGLGLTSVQANDTTMAGGVGLGASLHYEMGALFLGADARYMYNFSEDIDSGWRALAKVGFNIR